MPKTEIIRARIEPDLKHEVDKILKELGLKSSDAVNMLFRQIKMLRAIPFEVSIPNKETERAINDANKGRGLKKYKSVDSLFNSIMKDADNSNNKTIQKGSKKAGVRGKKLAELRNVINLLFNGQILATNSLIIH